MYSTLNVYLNIFYGKKVFRKLEREMVLPHHRIIKQDKIQIQNTSLFFVARVLAHLYHL